MMISEEKIAKEFTQVVGRVYPKAGRLLNRCFVKVVEFYFKRLHKHFYYITVYAPDYLMPALQAQKDALREVAENMGLLDVVFINATKLLRDPMSKTKQEDFRLWLELHWIATDEQ